MPRYELLDFQTLQQQDCINAYFYATTWNVGNSAQDLVEGWLDACLGYIRDIQADDVTHLGVGARNLDDPTDFTLVGLTSNNLGTRTSDPMPRFVAWGYRLIRTRNDVHHGSKRIAGVCEDDVTAGVATTGMGTALNAVATAIGDTVLGSGGVVEYEPQIARRVYETDENGDKHLVDFALFPISGAQYMRVTTQNTRKR